MKLCVLKKYGFAFHFLSLVIFLGTEAANASGPRILKIGIAANMSEVSLVDCNPFGHNGDVYDFML